MLELRGLLAAVVLGGCVVLAGVGVVIGVAVGVAVSVLVGVVGAVTSMRLFRVSIAPSSSITSSVTGYVPGSSNVYLTVIPVVVLSSGPNCHRYSTTSPSLSVDGSPSNVIAVPATGRNGVCSKAAVGGSLPFPRP